MWTITTGFVDIAKQYWISVSCLFGILSGVYSSLYSKTFVRHYYLSKHVMEDCQGFHYCCAILMTLLCVCAEQ